MIQKKQHFWYRWQREYLADLRKRYEGGAETKGKTPKVGDILLVYEKDTKIR